VIYMSGYSHEGPLMGVSGEQVVLLHKPFSPRELLSEARRVLDEG
jgi:hypothetical protein